MNNNLYTLITGASEGFGRALALECARRGMNLVLVALPGPELHSLSQFIQKNFAVKVIAIEKDLSIAGNCVELFKNVTTLNLKVNILINNAGIGNTHLFSDGSISFYQKQVQLNVMATTLLTRLFLDSLEKNGPSYILNVGSLCSFFFLAKKQVYGATKSFIYFFSKSLRNELAGSNVHVSVICPGGMNTNLSVTMVNKKMSWLSQLAVMNPENVAPIAIDGLLRQKEVIIPGRINKLFLLLNTVIPAYLKKMIANHQMKQLNSMSPANNRTLLQPSFAVTYPANIKPLIN